MEFDFKELNARQRLLAGVLVGVTALSIVLLLARACSNPAGGGSDPEAPGDEPPESIVYFEMPAIAGLGELVGPAKLVSVDSPNVVTLQTGDAPPVQHVLLGLRVLKYGAMPEQTPPSEKDLAERIKAQNDFLQWKTQQLAMVIGDKPLYYVRMGAEPSQIYLFKPIGEMARDANTGMWHGAAHLVQALALRRGVAQLEPTLMPHPLYDFMADAMIAGYVEARQRGGDRLLAPDLWTRFGLDLPGYQADWLEKLAARQGSASGQ